MCESKHEYRAERGTADYYEDHTLISSGIEGIVRNSTVNMYQKKLDPI